MGKEIIIHMTEKFKKSLSFVVSHYRPGAFVPQSVFAAPRPWWRRTAVAASVAAGVLVASALVYTYVADVNTVTPAPPAVEIAAPAPAPATAESVIRLEFTDMRLSEVVDNIERAYNVEISGMTDAEADLRLTLSYEGDAADLVTAINEILGTTLSVKP